MSEHPLPTHAIGEVVGHVAEQVGHQPDCAVLMVTAPSTGAIEDYLAAVHALLAPRSLIGSTAVAVMASSREAENTPAVSLWAGRVPGVRSVRIDTATSSSDAGRRQVMIEGFTPEADEASGTLALLADPFSFPLDGFVSSLAQLHPSLRVVGGLASAARGPGGNRLLCDEQIFDSGAVGLVFDDQTPLSFVVAQGCRPVGRAYTVTQSEGNRLISLGGQPAVERLRELLDAANHADRNLIEQGLHVGIVHADNKLDFATGDFLIRAVTGADSSTGSVTVGDAVPVGATVQFQVRDATSAHVDLEQSFAHRRAESALVFSCNGRGQNFFDEPDHDASVISAALAPAPVAGMFCAGEIGPVGGRNHLHGYTAASLLFH